MYLPLLTCLFLATSPGAVYSFRTNYSSVCDKTPMTLQGDFNTSCLALGENEDTCNMAWDAFQGAFAGVDPQNVNASDYARYFDILSIEALPDQSLFWSRTQSLVEILSMMNSMVTVVSSTNTIPAEVINNIATVNNSRLNWCGSTEIDGGIDFESCSSCNVTGHFWSRFSSEFAQVASGNAFYLTDGEDASGAYRNDSFFATVELPDVDITRLIALVVHRKGEGEGCEDTNGTIQNLRDAVRNRTFSFVCYDIYGQTCVSSDQSEKIANCVASVVGAVQNGTEGRERQIDCVSVSSGVTEQVSLLLLLTVHIMYWLM